MQYPLNGNPPCPLSTSRRERTFPRRSAIGTLGISIGRSSHGARSAARIAIIEHHSTIINFRGGPGPGAVLPMANLRRATAARRRPGQIALRCFMRLIVCLISLMLAGCAATPSALEPPIVDQRGAALEKFTVGAPITACAGARPRHPGVKELTGGEDYALGGGDRLGDVGTADVISRRAFVASASR
jgi:hypothetical protein